jgi:hypothetical protein
MAHATLPRSCLRIVTAYVRRNCVSYVGLRLIFAMGACTSIARRAALKAFIRCMGPSFGRYGRFPDGVHRLNTITNSFPPAESHI